MRKNLAVYHRGIAHITGPVPMETNPPSLRDEAIALYLERPAYIKPHEVAEAIGRTTEWLRLLSKGKLADPGVVTVEKLIAYINSRKGA